MEKKTVAVLFGGVSSEHDVSLISVTSVLQHIPTDRYDIVKVGITKDGRWLHFTGDNDLIHNGAWESYPTNRTAFFTPDPTVGGLVVKTDKGVTNILLEAADVPQAKFLWLYAGDYEQKKDAVREEITTRLGGYPVFVKPANAGSSVGVSKVHCEAELDDAIAKAAREDGKLVIEETIVGQEVECAVLGNEEPKASVVGEIATDADFYDYEDKYINGTSQLFIPARIPAETAEEIRKIAVHAYRSLGCGGLSRVDFFVRKSDGKIFLNELNTLPGFTSISMYPKLWEHSGLPYGELLDTLIQLAFART